MVSQFQEFIAAHGTPAGLGGRRQEQARVRVDGRVEDRLDRAALDDRAVSQDDHVMRDLPHDAEIVRDEQVRDVCGLLKVAEQIEDLRLDRHVEGRHGFVQDHDLGVGRERSRDRDPWRYPVKSMGGEMVDSSVLDQRALHGDRMWAVRDLELDAVTTARRLPVLLGCTARFDEEPPLGVGPGEVAHVVVTFPDGAQIASTDPVAMDARLSELAGKRVSLVPLPSLNDKAAYRGVLTSKKDVRQQFGVAPDEPLARHSRCSRCASWPSWRSTRRRSGSSPTRTPCTS